jgi:hypothetical protein
MKSSAPSSTQLTTGSISLSAERGNGHDRQIVDAAALLEPATSAMASLLRCAVPQQNADPAMAHAAQAAIVRRIVARTLSQR